jgi:N-acyl-D-aspartate/D-glutamate deacylase
LAQNDFVPGQWRELLRRTEEAVGLGHRVSAQVLTRPIGLLMGLETTLNPLQGKPSYDALRTLPLAERVRRLDDAATRDRIVTEAYERQHPFFALFGARWDRYFPMTEAPTYEPEPDTSVGAIATRTNQDPLRVACDVMRSDRGRGLLYVPFLNFNEQNLDVVRSMMTHPNAVYGLADGGAHVGTICDAGAPTTTLTHWGRDRRQGRFPLPWLVRFLTRRPAEAVGLLDRGLVAPGMKADLAIFDLDMLGAARPEIRHDLPAGGRRFLQRAHGYRAIVKSGSVTYREGEATGALPGRLVRSFNGT